MFSECITLEFSRIANFIPVFLGIGIGIYFNLSNESDASNIFIFLSLLTGACLLLKRIRYVGIACGIILLGFSISLLHTRSLNTNMLDKKIEYAKIYGTLDTVESTPNGIRFVISNVKCKQALLNKVSLTWRTKEEVYKYLPGDRVKFIAILDPIYSPTFKHAYDFRKQSFFNNISARGYVVAPPKIISSASNNTVAIFKNKMRHRIDKAIDSALSGQQAALVKTLVTGNKSALSLDTRTEFSNAGIAHILAISGLHIGIISGVFFIFFRLLLCALFPKFSLRYDIKKISIILALFFAFLYLQISGESVPAVRSFIMYGIIAIAVMLNRTALSMRSVSIAATAILLFKPEAILFPSFQMSFSAVMALVAFYERSWNKSAKFVAIISLLFSSIVASVATSIFAINTFNRLSLGGIISNLIAVPMMSFIVMPLMVFSTLILPIINVFSIAGPFMDVLLKLAKTVADVKYSSILLPTPDMLPFLLIVCGSLWMTVLISKIRWFGTVPILAGIIIYIQSERALIYVSAFDKVIGVNCGEYMCFNNMSSLRRISSDFIKTEGLEYKFNFNNKKCRKCVKHVADGVLYAYGFYIIDPEYCEDVTKYENSIILNDKQRKTAKIYYKNGKVDEFILPNRPWS